MPDQQLAKSPNEKFCSTCGSIIKLEAEICPKCGVRQMASKPQVSQEGADGFLKFVIFLFPIIGLILYFTWMDTKPKAAKEAGKVALISVIAMIVVIILIVIILVGIGLGMGH